MKEPIHIDCAKGHVHWSCGCVTWVADGMLHVKYCRSECVVVKAALTEAYRSGFAMLGFPSQREKPK